MDTKNRKIIWTVFAVALIVVGIFALNDWMRSKEIRQSVRKIDTLGTVPNFSLIGIDKKPFGSAELKGSYYVLDLIFTQCAGTCPMLTAQMATLQKSLTRTPQVKLVSISVDPNNDTPEVLAEYAKRYNADTKNWHFLTGPVSTIYDIAKNGLKLTVDSVSDDVMNPILHSERFVLIDKNGKIRGFYTGTEEGTNSKVLADIGELIRAEEIEKENAE